MTIVNISFVVIGFILFLVGGKMYPKQLTEKYGDWQAICQVNGELLWHNVLYK